MAFTDLTKEIPFQLPIKEILLGEGVAQKAKSLCGDYAHLHLVCDENTKDFVNLISPKTVLPANQKPTLAIAKELAKIECDCFVAVGSGTINDIVKYAAHIAGKPYVVFATALSMNGYASANASMLPEQGLKHSYAATAPRAIYMDTEILAAAPKRLRNAGIGDSICRATVQADCLLSHKLIGTPNYNEYFMLMQKYENDMFESIDALARTLTFSGVAMLMAGSSAPASGGEHMLAHFMELEQQDAPHSYHGEQIAVATVAMANIQLLRLQNDFEIFSLEASNAETEVKYSRIKPAKIYVEDFQAIIAGHEMIEQRLHAIGAPTMPSDIGWSNEVFVKAIHEGKLTRDRLTFLDLI